MFQIVYPGIIKFPIKCIFKYLGLQIAMIYPQRILQINGPTNVSILRGKTFLLAAMEPEMFLPQLHEGISSSGCLLRFIGFVKQ